MSSGTSVEPGFANIRVSPRARKTSIAASRTVTGVIRPTLPPAQPEYVASGCWPSPGAPEKISVITPRSRSVARYANEIPR